MILRQSVGLVKKSLYLFFNHLKIEIMAKIKLSGIGVVDIRGKLNGTIFSKNRGGAYVRTKVTPTNPQTVAQMFVRGVFAAISSAWSALSQLQRNSFNGFVAAYATTDIFGDLKNPSGKSLYQRLNQNLVISGQPQVTTCNSPIEVPFAGLVSVIGSLAAADLVASLSGNTAGSKIMFFATPPLSQGTTFVKNKLRLLTVLNGGNGLSGNIGADYTAKFGPLAIGANIYIGVKVVNANGQASPMETAKASITA